ncbi:hypothetical protein TWF730_009088 [Orbilia blumenaviensis]|uniref:F-box domain-containing protein n=1 Tax=Orbilia blumenaviensis TaxID=1796055 RepID=A0AAV9V0L4_9PEZI
MATNPSATQIALKIPELLESIIIWSLHLHYVYDDRCRRVNQLRRVAKAWRTTIDHNPTLRVFAFRDPLNTSPETNPHLATFCRPYCRALEYELAAVMEMRSHSPRKAIGFAEFQKVSHSISMEHSPLIKGYRKNRRVPRCLASDVFITKPTLPSVYLRFSGSSDHDWLEALKGIARPRDYVHNHFDNFEYDYNVSSPTGVTAKDLIQELEKAIKSFYKLASGSFMILKIEVWIGDPDLLKERPQSIPGWQVRMIWEPCLWKR